MKALKILSMLFAVFLFGANTTFAQSRVASLSEQQKEEVKKNVEAYAAAINLTEEQQSKFEEITAKYVKQVIAVIDSGGRPMSKFKKVKSIRKNKNAEMKRLLSKDQYKVYLEKQEEMQKKMRERRKANK